MNAGRAVWVKVRRVRAGTVAHSEVERERTRELTRLGSNLNRFARRANTHKGAVEVVAHFVVIERWPPSGAAVTNAP